MLQSIIYSCVATLALPANISLAHSAGRVVGVPHSTHEVKLVQFVRI